MIIRQASWREQKGRPQVTRIDSRWETEERIERAANLREMRRGKTRPRQEIRRVCGVRLGLELLCLESDGDLFRNVSEFLTAEDLIFNVRLVSTVVARAVEQISIRYDELLRNPIDFVKLSEPEISSLMNKVAPKGIAIFLGRHAILELNRISHLLQRLEFLSLSAVRLTGCSRQLQLLLNECPNLRGLELDFVNNITVEDSPESVTSIATSLLDRFDMIHENFRTNLFLLDFPLSFGENFSVDLHSLWTANFFYSQWEGAALLSGFKSMDTKLLCSRSLVSANAWASMLIQEFSRSQSIIFVLHAAHILDGIRVLPQPFYSRHFDPFNSVEEFQHFLQEISTNDAWGWHTVSSRSSPRGQSARNPPQLPREFTLFSYSQSIEDLVWQSVGQYFRPHLIPTLMKGIVDASSVIDGSLLASLFGIFRNVVINHMHGSYEAEICLWSSLRILIESKRINQSALVNFFLDLLCPDLRPSMNSRHEWPLNNNHEMYNEFGENDPNSFNVGREYLNYSAVADKQTPTKSVFLHWVEPLCQLLELTDDSALIHPFLAPILLTVCARAELVLMEDKNALENLSTLSNERSLGALEEISKTALGSCCHLALHLAEARYNVLASSSEHSPVIVNYLSPASLVRIFASTLRWFDGSREQKLALSEDILQAVRFLVDEQIVEDSPYHEVMEAVIDHFEDLPPYARNLVVKIVQVLCNNDSTTTFDLHLQLCGKLFLMVGSGAEGCVELFEEVLNQTFDVYVTLDQYLEMQAYVIYLLFTLEYHPWEDLMFLEACLRWLNQAVRTLTVPDHVRDNLKATSLVEFSYPLCKLEQVFDEEVYGQVFEAVQAHCEIIKHV